MNINVLLRADKIKFMKEGKKTSLSTVKLALDAVQKKEKSLQRPLTEEEEIETIQTMVKQGKEELKYAYEAKREEKIEESLTAIMLLESYLPLQLTLDELENIITDTINETEESSRKIGTIMKSVIEKTKGKADKQIISSLVKNLLN